MITTKQPTTSFAALKSIVPTKPDFMGNRWKPLPHADLVDTIHEKVYERGLEILDEKWWVAGKDLQRLQGDLSLRFSDFTPPDGMGFNLGVQHSNGGEHALKFAVGATVFICKNGMVSGDFAVKRKHTLNLDIQEVVGSGLDTYTHMVKELPEQKTRLENRGLVEADVNQILMDAGREGIMPWSRIGEVDAQYRKPRFSEFSENNAWSLYNAFTWVVQKCPPHNQVASMNAFRTLCLN
jgi:hypothetical protein